MKKTGWGAYAALTLLAFAAMPAHAEETTELPDLLISAGVEPLPTREVASSFTIVTAEEIETFQYRDLTDALRSVPGLHVATSGPRGGQTSVFTRGANSNQTLVMINGLPINDSASPGGAANLANIPLDNVDRIEVVRGPQSALYGSQAIGGVINIITKTGAGAPVTSLRVEGGTLGTLNTHASTGGSLDGVDYFLSLSREATNGSDATPTRLRDARGEEKDGNEVGSVSGRIGAKLNENLSASAFIQYTKSETDIDDDGSDAGFVQVYQNFDSTYDSNRLIMAGDLSGSFFDNKWRPKLSAGITNQKSFLDDQPDPGGSIYLSDVDYKGKTVTVRFDNAFDIHPQHLLTAGASYTRDEYSSSGIRDLGGFIVTPVSDADTDAFAVYASDHMTFGERFFATVSTRYDMPEDMEDRFTFTIAPGYYHPETDTRLTFSYGTGFKTPSLYQRYGQEINAFFGTITQYTGNPDLKPEKSKAWEVGVEQGFLEGRGLAGVTWFDSEVEDAISIEFDLVGNSSAVNVDKFDAKGIETFIQFKPSPEVTARIDYTLTIFKADPFVTTMTRRPRHLIGFTGSWEPVAGTVLSTNVQWVDIYRDIPRDSFGFFLDPGPYTVVNIAGSHKLTDNVTLTARVNNLLDTRYEPVNGLEAAGIEALAGVVFTF
ncbi:TonB-dependent receptor plug [Parvibaculum lavamentivorans DS-1]|uniref:TonB-dependent receptor plug n=1 Tax=Parvibaculum lavamentivorans (strain DS-1 / DSM 13023 / NCIMB 13966) TaxID=402881 RepID=A7HRA2_PARL1|nr:TonB-dependent receptor [Parvibaculum lavamentivorans]ABS62435.1 TonB-dependent receptor plug [Parvibaculum lavamentivorans DS-1]